MNSQETSKNLRIDWTSLQTAQEGEKPAGTSSSRVYLTMIGTANFETVLDIACRGCQGTNQPQALFNVIWSQFAGPANTVDVRGRPLQYWGGPNAPGGGKFGDERRTVGVPIAFDAKSLLRASNGRCGGWQDLMVRSVEAQNLTATRIVVWPRDLIPSPPEIEDHWDGVLIVVQSACRGQKSPNPQNVFNDHALGGFNNPVAGTLYDPSYGTGFSSEDPAQSWESAALEAVEHTNSDLGVLRYNRFDKETDYFKGRLKCIYTPIGSPNSTDGGK